MDERNDGDLLAAFTVASVEEARHYEEESTPARLRVGRDVLRGTEDSYGKRVSTEDSRFRLCRRSS